MKILDDFVEINAMVVRRNDCWEVTILNTLGETQYEFQWWSDNETSFKDIHSHFKFINGYGVCDPTILSFCYYLSSCDELPPIVNVSETRNELIK